MLAIDIYHSILALFCTIWGTFNPGADHLCGAAADRETFATEKVFAFIGFAILTVEVCGKGVYPHVPKAGLVVDI
jgi:hypothetical protein